MVFQALMVFPAQLVSRAVQARAARMVTLARMDATALRVTLDRTVSTVLLEPAVPRASRVCPARMVLLVHRVPLEPMDAMV